MSRINQHILDDDRIGHLLLKLSIPAFFGMFVMTLYNVIDTIFIGHYVGTLGIAGLSIVFPIQMLSIGIGQLVGMGGASLISRLIGAGDKARAERVLGNAVTIGLILSTLIMIIGVSDADFWLRLLGASETILPYAMDYMILILISLIFQTFAMTLNNLIRAEGNARIPMIGMITGALSNIILDAVFIIPLNMGIKGAALATLLAQVLVVIYELRYYISRSSFLRLHSKNLLLNTSIVRNIFSIGIASFAHMMAGSLSAALVNRVLVSTGGDISVSAFGVMNRILMFAIMPGIVIGQGLQPILGFNYGAKRYDRALKSIKVAMTAASICSIIVFVLIYFIPEPFIMIFTPDSELIEQSAYAAKRMCLGIYLIGFMMVGSVSFQSIGKAVESFITSVSRPALFMIPAIFILPLFWQIDGVWLSFPVSDWLASLLTLALFIPQIRELRKLRENENTRFR